MSKVDSPSSVTGWDSVIPLAMCREDPRVALAHLRIVLPSDPGWRDTNYQRLVDIQRSLNANAASAGGAASTQSNRKPAVSPEPMADAIAAERTSDKEDGEKEDEKEEEDEEEEKEKGEEEEEELTKRPRSTAVFQIDSPRNQISSKLQLDRSSTAKVFWSNADLMMAARLVSSFSAHAQSGADAQSQQKPPVSLLKDPEQMRRVYTLIYDVLRYKSVLTEALNRLNFMEEHPQLQDDKLLLTCLFFYNLYRKEFRHCEPITAQQEEADDDVTSHREVNDLLWRSRVRLGAIVSRMRIAQEARDLEQLLPEHLQDARSKVDDRVVCGWINYFKAKPRDVFAELDAFGLSHLPEGGGDELHTLTYKLDHILPRFLHALPRSRALFTCSPLFAQNKVIMQERTFCLGPASVAQLLVDLALTGVVAQTHVSSLVTVAYLANLLATNEKVDGLIVFGAGSRKELCEEYLQALGVTNTTVHAASFSELSAADSDAILANVVTVLATPPNTNSHVRDAVDLAVARGGDLLLLHQLTQDKFHAAGEGHTQVMHTMLAEQRDTLRMSMSKPQIQFVVYETHSRYDLENSEMVVRVITEMNGYATEKHLEEQRKRRFGGGGAQPEGGSSVDMGQPPNKMTDEEAAAAPVAAPPPMEEITINVPACDLFELSPLPDLCPHRDECLKLEEEGTFIAVIKRKEITRLDPKYMIEMAESRGLFGSKGGSGEGGSAGEGARRREQRRKAAAAQRLQRTRSNSADANQRSKVKVELERIAAPTHASMVRDIRLNGDGRRLECARHKLHLSGERRSEARARVWWTQLAEHVLDLIRDHVDLTADPPPDDLPRLRLKRSRLRPVRRRNAVNTPRTPLPMHVNYIEFQSDDDGRSSSDDDDDDILQLCPCLASVLNTSAASNLFTAVS